MARRLPQRVVQWSMPVAAPPKPRPAVLCRAVPEINNGKEANRLGKSDASHLNPFPFVLEAGLNFVHLFHEHLSLKSFELALPTCHFSPLHLMVSKYSVLFLVFFKNSQQVWWQNSSAGFFQQEWSTFHPLNTNNVTFAIFALAPSAPDT